MFDDLASQRHSGSPVHARHASAHGGIGSVDRCAVHGAADSVIAFRFQFRVPPYDLDDVHRRFVDFVLAPDAGAAYVAVFGYPAGERLRTCPAPLTVLVPKVVAPVEVSAPLVPEVLTVAPVSEVVPLLLSVAVRAPPACAVALLVLV